MTAPASAPADQTSLRIAASPQRIYDLVTDVAGMGRLSPECTGGRWLDGATGPAVGARFKGSNKRGFVRWSTTNTVVAAEPGVVFSFETGDSGKMETSPSLRHEMRVFTEAGTSPDNHLRQFLDCVKTRALPAANADVAAQSHIACHAAYISWQLNRKLTFESF